MATADPPDGQGLDELFGDELTAEEIQALREALERRIAQIGKQRAAGQLVDADWTDEARLAEQLAVLRQEELIADFVEDGIIATVRRAEMLSELGEGDETAG
jgi:hypothetical protein